MTFLLVGGPGAIEKIKLKRDLEAVIAALAAGHAELQPQGLKLQKSSINSSLHPSQTAPGSLIQAIPSKVSFGSAWPHPELAPSHHSCPVQH